MGPVSLYPFHTSPMFLKSKAPKEKTQSVSCYGVGFADGDLEIFLVTENYGCIVLNEIVCFLFFPFLCALGQCRHRVLKK